MDEKWERLVENLTEIGYGPSYVANALSSFFYTDYQHATDEYSAEKSYQLHLAFDKLAQELA